VIRGLRHIALRLWISLILGTFLAFGGMPLVNEFFPGHDPLVALGILAILYFVSGYAMTRSGEWLVLASVKQALTWERAGLVRRSEEKFLKALRLYDTPLISPFREKRVALILAGALAKFSLTFPRINPLFEGAVTAFLRMAPDEEETALLWLKRTSKGGQPGKEEHEILTLITEANLHHPEIGELAADILYASARTDFKARKVHGAVRKSSGPGQESFSNMGRDNFSGMGKETLAGMDRENFSGVGQETFSDMDRENFSGMGEFLGSEPLSPTGELQGFDIRANSDFSTRKRQSKGSNVLRSSVVPGARRKNPGVVVLIVRNILGGFSIIFQELGALLKAVYSFFVRRKALAKTVKWMTALAVFALFSGFMVNTMFHLFHTVPPTVEVEVDKPAVDIPKPFTIQVAAYLKKSHADIYVEKLKKKGLDVYIYNADGGGRTWYIIRIAHFENRESATEYGNELKRQHLIDDFFVDNNE